MHKIYSADNHVNRVEYEIFYIYIDHSVANERKHISVLFEFKPRTTGSVRWGILTTINYYSPIFTRCP